MVCVCCLTCLSCHNPRNYCLGRWRCIHHQLDMNHRLACSEKGLQMWSCSILKLLQRPCLVISAFWERVREKTCRAQDSYSTFDIEWGGRKSAYLLSIFDEWASFGKVSNLQPLLLLDMPVKVAIKCVYTHQALSFLNSPPPYHHPPDVIRLSDRCHKRETTHDTI